MPELPEVESLIRELRSVIPERIITTMAIAKKAVGSTIQGDALEFSDLVGHTISAVIRKGKYIILPMVDDSAVLVIHLGMTGKLLLEPSDGDLDNRELEKHTRIVFELLNSDTKELVNLVFQDVRGFGKVWFTNSDNINQLNIPGLDGLGIDALDLEFEYFKSVLDGTRRPIKTLLLDQKKIAGIGNIYADEALFAARIHPTRPANSLNPLETNLLRYNIKYVLKQGIKHRGSSVSDYVGTDGNPGDFQKYHRVYGKKGVACVSCQSPIQRIVVGGRGTHFCAQCQPEKG